MSDNNYTVSDENGKNSLLKMRAIKSALVTEDQETLAWIIDQAELVFENPAAILIAAAMNENISLKCSMMLISSSYVSVREALAANKNVNSCVLAILAFDESLSVRIESEENGSLNISVIELLDQVKKNGKYLWRSLGIEGGDRGSQAASMLSDILLSNGRFWFLFSRLSGYSKEYLSSYVRQFVSV